MSVNSLRNVKLSIRYNKGLVVWMIKFQKRTTKVLKRDTSVLYKLTSCSNGKTNIISTKNNTISN